MKSSNIVKLHSAIVIGVFMHMPWITGGCAKQQASSPSQPVATEPAKATPAEAQSASQPAGGKNDFKFAISLKGPDDKAVDWLVVEQWNTSADSG